eukprot:TRINITY_DN22567_c1_g1_i1.p1 TRINITY_DN22567_c1_g1~~TRINITY_DN22567_c1_g1_i1.p1  ORF type:complete len:618 (+),score=58.73 TRINITY_DN22567_c1_g1_i1:135-1988(+)
MTPHMNVVLDGCDEGGASIGRGRSAAAATAPGDGASRLSRGDALTQHKSLPSKLDAGMLRAVPISEVLSGFGRHFSRNAGKASNYNLSKCVTEIGDFVSHDWQTGRVSKMITLCYVYNRHPACIASCLAAVLVAYAGISATAGERVYSARFVCPFIWLAFLLLWQRMRSVFQTPRYTFLDKLCIHQTDFEKKTAGILGLAGFLAASRRMLVLWSPHYFSRLWCTYELAAWCHLQGTDNCKMEIRSVPAAMLQLFFTLVLAFCQAIGGLSTLMGVPSRASIVFAALVVSPLFVRLAKAISDMSKLPQQLQAYRIRQASCFCCTNGHRHPDTLQALTCDRDLIYSTLQQWTVERNSGRSSTSASLMLTTCSIDEALEDFDKLVQHSMLSVISRKLNTKLVIGGYTDCVLTAVPVFWSCCDYCGWLLHEAEYQNCLRWLLEYSAAALFVFPLAGACAVQVTLRLGPRLERTASERGLSSKYVFPLLVMLAYCGSLWLLWAPGHMMHDLGLPNILSNSLMLLRYALLALATKYALRTGAMPSFEVQSADRLPGHIERDGCSPDEAGESGLAPGPAEHAAALWPVVPQADDVKEVDGALSTDEHTPRASVLSSDSGESLWSL